MLLRSPPGNFEGFLLFDFFRYSFWHSFGFSSQDVVGEMPSRISPGFFQRFFFQFFSPKSSIGSSRIFFMDLSWHFVKDSLRFLQNSFRDFSRYFPLDSYLDFSRNSYMYSFRDFFKGFLQDSVKNFS